MYEVQLPRATRSCRAATVGRKAGQHEQVIAVRECSPASKEEKLESRGITISSTTHTEG